MDASGNLYVAAAQENRIYKSSPGGILTTVAGNGTGGYSGDNGPATSAQLSQPTGVALDSAGNLYIADSGNARIRKVAGGIITTFAGNGTFGFSGDTGPAVSAQLSGASAVAFDTSDNLYIADSGNQRIRKVSGGIITTVAGNGTFGFSGDTGPAISAQLANPHGVAVDSAGNLYIADSSNARIRKVAGGFITTVAGSGAYGFSGDGGPATGAQISYAYGVAVDSAGNLYIADSGNNRIRKVSGGTIITLAGGGAGCAQQTDTVGDGCAATNALLSSPYGVAVDSAGTPYLADTYNYRIRKIAGGAISTVVGNGSYQFSGDNGLAVIAQLNPQSVAVRSLGNFYVADAQDYRIRNVSGGLITTVAGTGACCYNGDGIPATSAQVAPAGVAADSAGNFYTAEGSRVRRVSGGVINAHAGNGVFGYSGDNGPATSAQLASAGAVAVDGAGNVYIADQSNNRVRKVSGGVITTVAGGGPADGATATGISLGFATGVAVDAAGNVYFPSSGDNRVYKVSTSGILTIVAGNGSAGFSGDNGPASAAQLNTPYGIAVNSAGTVVFIADRGNNRVRRVAGGVITTVAGGGFGCAQQTDTVGDGCAGTSALLNAPAVVAVDSTGANLYIADALNYRIRLLTAGVITTIAGNGTCCYSGDNGPATAAQLNYATGIAIDSNNGDLYIGDSESFRVRKVSGGLITTVAGTGSFGYSGDNGTATSAQLSYSYGVAIDNTGNLYIADAANGRIRKVAGGVITTVAGNGISGYSGDNGAATSAQINIPYDVAVDGAGNLYIADTNNRRIRKVSGGNITTIAGNGFVSFSGDGGAASGAQLNSPTGVAVDGAGTLYIADSGNLRIRQVSAGGVITTVAGNGACCYSGDTGPATAASIGYSPGIAADSGGNLYLADQGTSRIRRVSGGVIDTIAGNGGIGFSGDGGPATNATFNNPQALAVDSAGNIYVADTGNSRIRLLTTAPRTIASIAPASVNAGTAGFNLQVNGSGFIGGDIVQWNGSALTTTFVNSGQLTAIVGAGLISQSGTAAVSVNGLSNAVVFTILPPAKIATILVLASSLTPSTLGRAVTLTATVNPSAATGSVTFYDGTSVLATRTLAAGQAAFTTALLASGGRSLKAYYGGDSAYAPGISAGIVQTVNPVSGSGFAAAVNYGGLTLPRSIAVGDFDRDGKADLAVVNCCSNGSVSILLGNGNGIFQSAVNYGAGAFPSWPTSVAAGDFNADGNPDLAVANNYGVAVLLGNGNGTFQTAVQYAGGSPGRSVAVGDFNGDGRPDLAVANGAGNSLSILLGNGNGTFQPAVTYATGSQPESVAVGDFNGDGYPDLAVANLGGSNVSVLLGNGDGTFQSAINYSTGSGPTWLVVGDLNGDGRADLAVANLFADNVSVLLGNGNGTFQAAVNYTVGSGPRAVALGDFNGDGKPDLAVANANDSSVSVLPGNGDGTFRSAQNYGVGSSPEALVVGDFNGDGRSDLAVANNTSNSLSVLLGQQILPSDFNQDGHPDVIWQDSVSGLAQVWFLGGAQGTAVLGAANLTLSNIWRIAGTGDFNGDGRPDVVWQDPATGAAQVWFLGGAQGNIVTGAGVISTGNAWRIMSIADFNGDGRPDLLWQDPATGLAQIWFMGGPQGTTVTGAVNLTLSNSWRIVGTGDFNQDGRPDVLWQDPVSGATQIWYLGGAQGNVVTNAINLSTGNSWRIAAVADFNGDGRPDVVWQDPVSGTSQVWLLSGVQGATVTGTAPLSGANSWRIVGPR